MKKLLLTLICLILITPHSFAYYEYVRKMPVLYADKNANNIIVDLGGKKMLLHYSGNCDAVADSSYATINVRSTLDGLNDYLIMSSYQKCVIDQAEEINGVLAVTYAYSDNRAIVTDERNNKYYIRYGSECSRLPAYKNQNIFLRKYGSNLNTGDKIYLPGKEGMCSIFYTENYETKEESVVPAKTQDDIQRPTAPSNLTTTPGNKSVALNWRASKDNIAIDHYVVSYSKYSFKTKNYSYEEMPNKIKTDSNATNYIVRDLENAESYFFYVIAVDTSGNISSEWSNEATATPRSSIVNWDGTSVPVKLLIYKTQETDKHILFKWNRIPSFVRQTVSLDVNRVRDFSVTNWSRDYIHIYKTDDKKGKSLKLTVRQFDIYDQMFSREFNFLF